MMISCRWRLSAGAVSLCLAACVSQLWADEAEVAVERVGEVAVQTTTNVDVSTETTVEVADDSEITAAPAKENSTGAKPTHKQSSLININADGLTEATALCFCLMGDDKLLVGCEGATKEMRVFDKDGEFLTSIELSVKPEAINIAPDGAILAAGEGKLLRLNAAGDVISEADAPHADALRENRANLREEVVQQYQQQAASMPQLLKAYDQAIEQLEQQIADAGEAEKTTLESNLSMYKDARKQLADQVGEEAEPAELTEEKIDELVEASLAYKKAVASISGTADAVFIASRAPVGYGFEVWRTDVDFANAEKIVTDLSGCCGQMDVQASEEGVFVAENSKKRVCRFDAQGNAICDWGKSSEGVDGFGSCCNPMNLAFGADGSVYTAEDTTGRIKRYSPKGELLSVVGAADVVPGCKKVSIGVDSTGDRVYMLDITRNNVAVLSRVLPDPTGPIAEAESSGGLAQGLLRVFGLGN